MIRKLFNRINKKSRNFGLHSSIATNFNEALYYQYKTNVIVYRCINIISETASHVDWKADQHILKILQHPRPACGGAAFFSEIIANKLLFGNAYIYAALVNSKIQELHLLDPLKVSIAKKDGYKIGYNFFNERGESKIYYIDPISYGSQILHIKNYNPFDKDYGISPLAAVSRSVELHNKSLDWNCSLLKRGARPSGALIVKDQRFLTDEQFIRLKEQFDEQYTGVSNSGKPLLLEGGLDWREMSINPRDMDFIESKNSAAREIALAFGVPPQLLGISGDNTYNNMQEARIALWEETLLPLLDNISDDLSAWFSYLYKSDIKISFNRDSISALSEKRYNIWEKLSKADFISNEEKRKIAGL